MSQLRSFHRRPTHLRRLITRVSTTTRIKALDASWSSELELCNVSSPNGRCGSRTGLDSLKIFVLAISQSDLVTGIPRAAEDGSIFPCLMLWPCKESGAFIAMHSASAYWESLQSCPNFICPGGKSVYSLLLDGYGTSPGQSFVHTQVSDILTSKPIFDLFIFKTGRKSVFVVNFPTALKVRQVQKQARRLQALLRLLNAPPVGRIITVRFTTFGTSGLHLGVA